MSGRRRPVNQTIKLRFEYIALGNLQFHLFSTNSDAIRDRIETVNLLDYPHSAWDISIIVSLIPIKYRRHNANAITLNSIPTNPYSSSYKLKDDDLIPE